MVYSKKYQDTRHLKCLKDELDRRETKDKLISVRHDIIEANKRVNYRNQIDRPHNEIQRNNLPHNSLEHFNHQINQFKKCIILHKIILYLNNIIMATARAKSENINTFSKYGFRGRPTHQEIIGLIDENEKLTGQLLDRSAMVSIIF